MPIKVEAAIVTQKRPLAEYNTDSVNVNGKVMPREVILNGYKGSGILSGRVHFTLASSDVEGFADASVVAFNDRAELFSRARDPISVFSGFFEDCRSALFSMKRSENELVSAGFYSNGKKAVLAHNGETKLYLQRLGIVTPVTADKVEDTTADFSAAVFNDVCEGDIFILLSPGAAQVLGDKEIEDILRISDGSVKRIVNYILKVALASDGDKAVSAIAVRVLEAVSEEEILPETEELDAVAEEEASASDAAEEKAEEVLDEDNASAEEAAEEGSAENSGEAVAEEAEAEENVTDDAEAEAEESVSEEAEAEAAEETETENSDEAASEEAEEASETAEETADADEDEDIVDSFSKNALEMFGAEDIVNAEEESEPSDAEGEDAFKVVFDEAAFFEDTSNEEAKEEKKEKGTGKLKTLLLLVLGMVLSFVASAIVVFLIIPAFSGSNEEIPIEEITADETTTATNAEDETASGDISEDEATPEEATTEEAVTEEAASESESVFVVG